MNREKTLLIIEDNPRDRDYLDSLFPDYAVAKLADGNEAASIINERYFPYIISDIQMPGMDGIQLAKTLWQTHKNSRIIFWTQFSDEMYLRALAKIIPPETVYGFVLKNNRAETLRKAAQTVFVENQCWIDSKVRPVQARLHNPHQALTDTEYEALIDIALGLTDNTIAKRRYLSRRGVQNRLKSLYEKITEENGFSLCSEAFNSRSRTISIAFRRGLINAFTLEEEEKKLQSWLSEDND